MKTHRLILTIVAALCLYATGCTASQRTTAGVIASDVATLAPVACAVLTAVGQPQAGSACGAVASDVSAVAKLVQSILDSLPAPAPGMLPPGPGATPAGFVLKGVTVMLPSAALVAKVQAKLPAEK